VFACPPDVLGAHTRVFEADLAVPGAPSFATLGDALDPAQARDAVFVLAFHGGAGEDGTVQRELERRKLAFTGSGSAASGRVVAKPIADGSSVGLHHVRAEGEIPTVARAIAASKLRYIAEAFIDGRELTVGVIDDGRSVRALPVSEVRIAPGRAFDFEGKYLGHGTVEITPAEVSEAVSRAAQALAVDVHTALGCEGYSRTDVITTERGPVFLETNTLPGLTRASFLPQQLAAEKITVRGFLENQIALARRRRERA
jgi:D-alanine-D-alanine ligase